MRWLLGNDASVVAIIGWGHSGVAPCDGINRFRFKGSSGTAPELSARGSPAFLLVNNEREGESMGQLSRGIGVEDEDENICSKSPQVV